MGLVFTGCVFVCVTIALLFLFYVSKKKKRFNNTAIEDAQPTLDKSIKIFLFVAVGIFVVLFILRVFSNDFFYDVQLSTGSSLFSNASIVGLTLLRFFTQGLVVVLIIVPFFKIKALNTMVATFGTLLCVLNIIFFKGQLVAFEGADWSWFSYRAIQFAMETAVASCMCAVYLFTQIASKRFDKKFWTSFAWGGLVLFLMSFLMMYPSTLQTLFGTGLDEAEGFNQVHRICLYLIVGGGLATHFVIRKKSSTIKYATCLMVSITGVVSFFITYTWKIPLTALPLHLCNAALIVSLFSMIFKSKKLFYFTYFVNVLGAVFALLIPDTSGSILTSGNVRFWLNHITVVLVPIWAVAWDIFPRPNIKMMKNSIIVFCVYFLIACISNMLISTVDSSVNYFFLNNDFFVDKFPWAYPLRGNFAYSMTIGGMTLNYWPLYWFVIFCVYIASMFIMWLGYAYIYKVADGLKKINELRAEDKMDMLKFKKDVLKGGDITAVINNDSAGKIEIKNFTKVYGNSKTPAVEDFSLTVEKGQVFGFLGHNGAGKSTLIKSMVGIQSITDGSITICGYDIEHQPLQAKLQLGYVSDNHAVYEKLTGREYINFVGDLYLVPQKERDERLEEYAKLFNLSQDIDREIKGYSHGMKQKLVVIASIIHNPKVWILDEPLTGLDPMSSHQIKTLMRQKADEGCIVFFSSHVIEVVEKICDKIAIIARGKLRGVYDIDQLSRKDLSLEELYLGEQVDKKPKTVKKPKNNEENTTKTLKNSKKQQ